MKKYRISNNIKISIKDFENTVNFFGANSQEDFDEKFLDRLFLSLTVRDQQKRLKMKTKDYPDFLVRPDDFQLFSKNKDGITYSIDNGYKDSLKSSYSFHYLTSIGFCEIKKENIDYYKEKRNDYLLKIYRSSGGCGE